MPKLAGLAVAERLYDGQRVPSVMCSAFPRSLEDDGAGDGVGVFGFVVKPVVLEQFRASVGVAWFRYCEAMSAERELAALRRRLEERRYVEQAKWRIVERQGVPEGEALRAMQRRARSTRRRLGEVAQALLSGEEELRVEPRRRAGRGPRR
jgi:response regulator NasT